MERNARIRLQMAAAAMLTATREYQLANAASLLFGRTSQQYHTRCCRGQHGRFEGRHATRQVRFGCFQFALKINSIWDIHNADVEDFRFPHVYAEQQGNWVPILQSKVSPSLTKVQESCISDLWGTMDISKSVIQPNQAEEKNPRFTLIYSILLSGWGPR